MGRCANLKIWPLCTTRQYVVDLKVGKINDARTIMRFYKLCSLCLQNTESFSRFSACNSALTYLSSGVFGRLVQVPLFIC